MTMSTTTDFAGTPQEDLIGDAMFQHFRATFKGTLIADIGIDAARGDRRITEGRTDLTLYWKATLGRPYTAHHPKLVGLIL